MEKKNVLEKKNGAQCGIWQGLNVLGSAADGVRIYLPSAGIVVGARAAGPLR